MDKCKCNCHVFPIQSTNYNKIECYNNLEELPSEIANIEKNIIGKNQDIKDYNTLESKFRQIQNEIQLLSEEKLNVEYELLQTGNEKNKLISNLKIENEKLEREINEKEILNDKLYKDNNNLFRVLEGKTKENQNLKVKVNIQQDLIRKLNQDKLI